jgi:hypothetical protein
VEVSILLTLFSSVTEEDEEWEERLQILSDTRKLKQAAEWFLHPEKPVETSIAVSRCYFDRPSAPERLSYEEAEEQAACLADAKALKQLADDYLHPEKPVEVAPEVFGRNYFSLASAPEQESPEEAEERAQILADAAVLKTNAEYFMHPEKPVEVAPEMFGRNYFSRASAPEQESPVEAEERAQIFAEAAALKKNAEYFMHPEKPVEVAPEVFGRNYFSRASAPEEASREEAEERAQILADAAALKRVAVDYLHPELPVVTTDSAACGRNFFTRASAPEYDTPELAEARSMITKDLEELKKAAADYLHPERPVEVDPAVFGRSYFDRPTAPEQESLEEAEIRAIVMEDLKAFKQFAVDFLHPEHPVRSHGGARGRNYFSRASAPAQESPEEAEERARILADAQALKSLAVHHMHPEKPVVTTDPTAFGRGYFDRPSAVGHAQMIHTFPPHEDDETEHHHEHLDHFGMDEDHVFDEMRRELGATGPSSTKPVAAVGSDDESNLSRSPSSVMLFTDEPIYD